MQYAQRTTLGILGNAAATGRFISIDFIKRDGTPRSMVVKVPRNALDRFDSKGTVLVFDVRKKATRSFSTSRLLYITTEGSTVMAITLGERV